MNGAFGSSHLRNCAAVISHIRDAAVVSLLHQNVDDAHFLGDLLHHRLHRVLVVASHTCIAVGCVRCAARPPSYGSPHIG